MSKQNRGADKTLGVDEIAGSLLDRVAAHRERILEDLSDSSELGRDLVRIAICHPNSAIRASAVVSVHRTMSPGTIVPLLEKLLDDLDFENRGRAGWALGKQGSEATSALDSLVRHAETDPDVDPRFGALWAVARLGPVASKTEDSVCQILISDQDDSVRAIAATALWAMGAKSEMTTAALSLASAEDGTLVREEAARALGQGGASRQATEALVKCLEDRSALVREAATEALSRTPDPSEAAIEALMGCLNDAPSVASKAADTLRILGQPVERRATPLDTTPPVGQQAEQQEHFDRWAPRLDADTAWSRAEAAWMLGILGPDAYAALPRLLDQAHSDVGSDARWAACLTIGRTRLPTEPNLRVLTGIAAQDHDPDVRAAAVEALGGLGLGSSDVVMTVSRSLADEDSLVREEACSALGRIAYATGEVRHLLEAATEDPHPSVRARATTALADIRRLEQA